MNKYKDWDLFDTMPQGWSFCKTAGSPLHGYEFASNGLSVLNGGKRALVRVIHPQIGLDLFSNAPTIQQKDSKQQDAEKPKPIQDDPAIAKTVNDLARARFKHKLLTDILVDISICEIEGWSKLDYIKELQDMLNEIGEKHQ